MTGGKAGNIRIRPLDETYRGWANRLLEEAWGAPIVVSRGRVHDCTLLPGFVAVREDQPVGLVTYRVEGKECELLTINSKVPGIGIGSALVNAVKEAALAADCKRLWLITTNDNLAALRFYQRRGFTLAALHRNALRKSRRLKPQIPLTGLDGIPLRDEIELEMDLLSESA